MLQTTQPGTRKRRQQDMSNMNSGRPLADRIAFITGASRGIGAATALALAGAGAHVIVAARTEAGLRELERRILAAGSAATLMPLDVRDPAAIDRAVAAVKNDSTAWTCSSAMPALSARSAPCPRLNLPLGRRCWQSTSRRIICWSAASMRCCDDLPPAGRCSCRPPSSVSPAPSSPPMPPPRPLSN